MESRGDLCVDLCNVFIKNAWKKKCKRFLIETVSVDISFSKLSKVKSVVEFETMRADWNDIIISYGDHINILPSKRILRVKWHK